VTWSVNIGSMAGTAIFTLPSLCFSTDLRRGGLATSSLNDAANGSVADARCVGFSRMCRLIWPQSNEIGSSPGSAGRQQQEFDFSGGRPPRRLPDVSHAHEKEASR
jgi:hypothetical protein